MNFISIVFWGYLAISGFDMLAKNVANHQYGMAVVGLMVIAWCATNIYLWAKETKKPNA